jgi:hypothetical protein
MGRKPIDMIGKRFHRLVVLYRDGSNEYSKPMYRCLCDCGKKTRTQGNYLRINKTKSCGCLTTATHGLSKHPLWGNWNSMKQRCYNPNVRSYSSYGAKDIKICNEWLNNFQSFFDWATNNGWKRGLTIDRIDPTGDYCPKNCRFITRSENSSRRF